MFSFLSKSKTPDAPEGLTERALDDFPVEHSLTAALTAPEDCVFFPDLPAPPGKKRTFLGRETDEPFFLVLNNAQVFPMGTIKSVRRNRDDTLPRPLTYKDQVVVLTQRNELTIASFGRERMVHTGLSWSEADGWQGDLPAPKRRMEGTHFFAETVFGHFGHLLVDTPGRLWPFASEYADQLKDLPIAGVGMMGAGPKPRMWPSYMEPMTQMYGLDIRRPGLIWDPVVIDRLVVPIRRSPHMGRPYPEFNAFMRHVATRVMQRDAYDGPLPEKLFLSRSSLTSDNRATDTLQRLDAVFEGLGYTVVAPERLPMGHQAALVRGARYVAGPTGSQLHLCAFSDRRDLKLLTIAPHYFKTPINQNIMRVLGSDETLFESTATPDPKGVVRHQAPWALSEDEMQRLPDAVRAWESS